MRAAGSTSEPALLERAGELSALEEALAHIATERGAPLIIEGPAGIGKTRLLSELSDRARARGVEVLSARGGELERDHPFGLARQLFGPLLRGAADPERRRLLAGAAAQAVRVVEGGDLEVGNHPASDPSHAILHGLDRLLANLAARGPVLAALDDAHWGDSASLRWLAYTARRLAEVPVLLTISLRPPQGEAERLLDPVLREPAAWRLEPAPLSQEACKRVVLDAFPEAEAEFARACQAATGGNPFYLSELLRAVAADRIAPAGTNAGRVLELSPDAVARAALGRLRAMPDAALPLARAVAVLGADVELRQAAAVAGVDEREASVAAEALARAEILRDEWPLEFAHPIVRTVIRADISAAAAARLHATAARVLADDHADIDRVAAHLLAAQPAGDAWAAELLRRAAASATGRGAPEAAARYLRRAVAEPVREPDRRDTLRALGVAESRSGGDAVRHLEEALELSEAPQQRAEIASELGGCLLVAGRAADAVRVVEKAIADLPPSEREFGLRLESELYVYAHGSLAAWTLASGRSPRFEGDLDRLGTLGDRLAAAVRAVEASMRRDDPRTGVDLATRVLEGGFLDEVGSDAPAYYCALAGLFHAGALEETERALDAALEHAATGGSIRDYAMVTAWRAAARYRRGRVREAEADARESLNAHGQVGIVLGVPIALAFLVESLLEQGRFEDAESELAPYVALTESDFAMGDYLRLAAGRLRLAQGRAEEALDHLLAAGRNQEAWGLRSPYMVPWRSSAAPALARLGRDEEARRLVEEELEIANGYGAPAAVGVALRAAGTLARREGIPLLSESVSALSGSGAELEHARSLAELGAALRRAGRRPEAREPLREALDVAHRCGAVALAKRAREELVAAGAKPRRDALRGRDALTASEARVAHMASQGMTNKEIAAELVVTPKTVEVHLGHVYRKLDISSRRQLPEALAERAGPHTPGPSIPA